MKVTIEIEEQDYINAITPFRNGCAFRARFEADGKVTLEPGCYLLVNLVGGVERQFLDQWRANGEKPFEIHITQETRHRMMEVRPCAWCGGALVKRRNDL